MGLLIALLLSSLPVLGMQVQVTGARIVRPEVIREQILSKANNDDRQLEQLRFKILNVYHHMGFIDAQVLLTREGPKKVLCQISEGNQILVGSVGISGTKYFSDEQLQKVVFDYVDSEPLPKEWLAPNRGSINAITNPSSKKQKVYFEHQVTPFNRSLFVRAKEAIENLYLDNGFLEVQIYGPKESEIEAKHWVHLQYRVDEGEQTFVQKIEIQGASWPEGLEQPALKVKDPLNPDRVEDLRAQLEENYQNDGYPRASVSSQISEADIRYQVNLGDRVQINEIYIIGNRVTKNAVIEKRLKIRVGDWYSLKKLSESRSDILQSDLFSEVSLDLSGDTLWVEVKERERNTFEVGAGGSLVDGPRVMGMWQHRNIFGEGITFRTRALVNYPAIFYDVPILYSSDVSQAMKDQTNLYLAGRLSAGFLYPRLRFVPFEMDAGLDFSAQRVLQQAYVLNGVLGTMSLYSQVFSKLRVTPQVELEYANFNCSTCGKSNSIAPSAASRFDQGVVKQATFRLLTTLDFRDNSLAARKGIGFELNSDLGLGSAETAHVFYGKLVAGVSSIVPIFKRLRWVSNTRAGGIWNFGNGTYVPLFKRFYLGGTDSVRGFQDNQVFPADAQNTGLVSLGGNYIAYTRNELRFPIWGDWEGGMFIDAGELVQDLSQFEWKRLAVGAGFGVRYQTPIGPLMLDLGVKLFDGDRLNRSNIWNLLGVHFSIGNAI